MEWTQELVLEFIELYAYHPEVWDPKHPQHKDKYKVIDAWRNIQKKLSTHCSVNELKKKKDSLMATNRKLFQKVKESMRTGSGTEDIFIPDWFAFDAMDKFLSGIYQPNKTISSEDTLNEDFDNDTNKKLIDESLNELESNVSEVEESEAAVSIQSTSSENILNDETSHKLPKESSCKSSSKTTDRKRKRKAPDMDQRMEEAYNVFKKFSGTENISDDCSLYAELLAKKLRNLDESTRSIAMLEIDQLMYRLQFSNSQQNFPNPVQYSPYNMQNYYSLSSRFSSNVPAKYSKPSSSQSAITQPSHYSQSYPVPNTSINFQYPQKTLFPQSSLNRSQYPQSSLTYPSTPFPTSSNLNQFSQPFPTETRFPQPSPNQFQYSQRSPNSSQYPHPFPNQYQYSQSSPYPSQYPQPSPNPSQYHQSSPNPSQYSQPSPNPSQYSQPSPNTPQYPQQSPIQSSFSQPSPSSNPHFQSSVIEPSSFSHSSPSVTPSENSPPTPTLTTHLSPASMESSQSQQNSNSNISQRENRDSLDMNTFMSL